MKTQPQKRIHFVSLGCVKNRVDTEVMLGVAQDAGYALSAEADDANVIVVNTCGFIGEAKRESIDTIIELSELKESGSCEKLIVAGCLSQRYPGEMASEMPEVDHFLGSSDMLKLGAVLRGEQERMLVGNPADWIIAANSPRVLSDNSASAYVKIAEGCNRTCSFCVIPQMRGKQRSRTADDVVREVESLVSQGIREINLISQDTISWGRDLDRSDRIALAELVKRVADTKGVHWVRLFYLYPETIDEALLDVIGNHPRVVPYVDMPLQHASDPMLKLMRRGHGQDRQRKVVARMKEKVPNLVFRTAFIVGHPGETDVEFEELCEFVRWAEFDHVGVFRYSDEESCKSFALEAKVSTKVAGSRYRKLMTVQRKIARAKNNARIGQELEVLVEGPSEEHEFVMKGRHAGQAPEIDGQVFLSGDEVKPGEFVKVTISQASDYDLVGEVVGRTLAAPKKRIGLKVLSAREQWQ